MRLIRHNGELCVLGRNSTLRAMLTGRPEKTRLQIWLEKAMTLCDIPRNPKSEPAGEEIGLCSSPSGEFWRLRDARSTETAQGVWNLWD